MDKIVTGLIDEAIKNFDISKFSKFQLASAERIIDGKPCYLFAIHLDGDEDEVGFVVIERFIPVPTGE
jgi:hypothetical protein